MKKSGEKEKLGLSDFLIWMTPTERKWRWRDFFWIKVETPYLARWGRGFALALAGFIAIGRTVFVIFEFLTYNSVMGGFFTSSKYGYWIVLSSLLWILVAWGLLKMRREAALVGLVLSLIDFDRGIMEKGGFTLIINAVAEIFFIWAFVNAIRGTFAYQRFAKMRIDSAPRQVQ